MHVSTVVLVASFACVVVVVVVAMSAAVDVFVAVILTAPTANIAVLSRACVEGVGKAVVRNAVIVLTVASVLIPKYPNRYAVRADVSRLFVGRGRLAKRFNIVLCNMTVMSNVA